MNGRLGVTPVEQAAGTRGSTPRSGERAAEAGPSGREKGGAPGLAEILPAIDSLFARVRSGLRARWAVRGLEAALAAGLSYVVAAVVIDRAFAPSSVARAVLLAGLAAVAGGVLVQRLVRSAAARIGPLYLASRVEASYPGFAGRLISSVELRAESWGSAPPAALARAANAARPSGGREAAHTPPKATELIYEQAEALARRVDASKVIARELERTSVHRWLLAAMAVTLLTALVMGDGFGLHARRFLFPWLEGPEAASAFASVRRSAERIREGEGFFVWALVSGEAPREVTVQVLMPGTGERAVRMARSSGGAKWTAEVPRVEASGSFRLRAAFVGGKADLTSKEFPFTLLKAPRAENIRVTYLYPGYAKRPPRTQEGGAVDALLGTKVVVEVAAEGALASARLAPPGGKPVEMSRRTKGGRETWVGGFTIRRSGSYEIALVGEGGMRLARAFPVVARPDSPPSCDAVYEKCPPREVLSRGARFNVRAADDLGVEELVLVVRRAEREGAAKRASARAQAGGRPPRSVLYLPVPGFARGRREVDLGFTIPPQVMRLEPGVTYSYYVRAADGRPPEPHLVSSHPRTFRIDVPETEGLLARARSRKKKKRPRLLEPRDGLTQRPPQGGGRSRERGGRPPPSSRRLAGLQDPPGGAPPPPGSPGGRGPPPKSSRYASGSGLRADEQDQNKQDQNEQDRKGRGGRGGERGGKPALPGQGEYGGGRPKTAGGRPSPSGGPAGGRRPGGGRAAEAGGPGGRGSGVPEGTRGSDRPGGAGGRGTGLSNRTPVNGGMPTGGETGKGSAMPETVDRDAVARLDVRPEEVAGMRVPGRPSAGARRDVGKIGDRGVDKVSDLGQGRGREVGRFTGADRLTIPRREIPPLEVLHLRPVSRAYRPLVGEYFRRLAELSERK